MDGHETPAGPGQRLTRRQLIAGGVGLAAGAVAGRTLVEAWRQLGREDLIPGDPPSIQLEPSRWRTTGEDLAFAVLGDNGSGGRQAMQVAEQMALTYREEPFGLVTLLGDICYYGPIARRFDDVFVAPLRPLIEAGVEFELAIGNHDGELFVGDPRLAEVEATLDLLGTPARYYATSRGPVDFFHLDSVALVHALDGGRPAELADQQLAWLDQALGESTNPWRIVCSHHPIHSSGRHGATDVLQAVLEPVLVAHDVDLVLAGHDHHYERTVPIEGITHVVSGAGCKLTPVHPTTSSAIALSTLQFMRVDVQPERLRGRAIGADGRVLDQFELSPRGRG